MGAKAEKFPIERSCGNPKPPEMDFPVQGGTSMLVTAESIDKPTLTKVSTLRPAPRSTNNGTPDPGAAKESRSSDGHKGMLITSGVTQQSGD